MKDKINAQKRKRKTKEELGWYDGIWSKWTTEDKLKGYERQNQEKRKTKEEIGWYDGWRSKEMEHETGGQEISTE